MGIFVLYDIIYSNWVDILSNHRITWIACTDGINWLYYYNWVYDIYCLMELLVLIVFQLVNNDCMGVFNVGIGIVAILYVIIYVRTRVMDGLVYVSL